MRVKRTALSPAKNQKSSGEYYFALQYQGQKSTPGGRLRGRWAFPATMRQIVLTDKLTIELQSDMFNQEI
jgi:hypothetical protein